MDKLFRLKISFYLKKMSPWKIWKKRIRYIIQARDRDTKRTLDPKYKIARFNQRSCKYYAIDLNDGEDVETMVFGHWKSGDVAIVVLVRLKDVLYKGYRETTYCSNISVIPTTTYHPKFPSIGTFLEVNTHKLTMLKCNSYTKGWWIYHNLRIICNFIIKYCYVKTCYIKANMTNQINKIGFE